MNRDNKTLLLFLVFVVALWYVAFSGLFGFSLLDPQVEKCDNCVKLRTERWDSNQNYIGAESRAENGYYAFTSLNGGVDCVVKGSYTEVTKGDKPSSYSSTHTCQEWYATHPDAEACHQTTITETGAVTDTMYVVNGVYYYNKPFNHPDCADEIAEFAETGEPVTETPHVSMWDRVKNWFSLVWDTIRFWR